MIENMAVYPSWELKALVGMEKITGPEF